MVISLLCVLICCYIEVFLLNVTPHMGIWRPSYRAAALFGGAVCMFMIIDFMYGI